MDRRVALLEVDLGKTFDPVSHEILFANLKYVHVVYTFILWCSHVTQQFCH